jgi:hypothetical protein
MSAGGAVPLVYANDDATLLLALLRTLPFSPELPNVEAARLWLGSRPGLFGWFDQMEDLSASLEAVSTDVASDLPVGTRTGLCLIELLI